MALTLLHLLDWAIIAVSIFNTVALLWLGLTVLLNAERRHFGAWAAGGGLLFGGLFFVGHSAVVGRVIGTFSEEMELWWRVGWLPFIGGPYLWYLVIAWYTGVAQAGRHRLWIALVTALGLAAVLLLALGNPLPSFSEVAYERAPGPAQPRAGLPPVVLVYPVYAVLCVALALLALRRPEASQRFMGDLARRRAYPWLVAASLAMLAVSLAVGGATTWLLVQALRGELPVFSFEVFVLILGFDLLISSLIALIAVLAGQAIVSYEVFTGKALPRGGLRRYWRRSLVLAAGYGALVGGSLALPVEVDPIWQLMLATVLMTLFFALLSWRSYHDRDQTMARLRPFVASQRLYDRLLQAEPSRAPEDAAEPFRALCEEVLGASRARLLPLGPLAPLVAPLAYPPGDPAPRAAPAAPATIETGALSSLVLRLSAQPGALCLPLDPPQGDGMAWAVPLWSERGLIGALLLGPKRDGALYTQEEIELARAAGERLVDTAAGAEMARRLMGLQRQRMAEDQVMDRRARRALHDDVLPRIHELMLTLQPAAGQPADTERALAGLAGIHKQIADLLHAMPSAAAPEVARLGLLDALRRSVEGEFAGAFERVVWEAPPAAEEAARRLSPLAAEVAFYAAREAVRNAARHGRGASPARALQLTVSARAGDGLSLRVEDDGVGLDGPAQPGGSGSGLDLHSTLIAVVGGALTVQSLPGAGTSVTLQLPVRGA